MFTVPIEAVPWGTTGPQALTCYLREAGEIEHAKPQHVFYPAGWRERRKFLRPREKYFKTVQKDTVPFHFYGRIVRRVLAEEEGGIPKKNSILEELCHQHNIDPNDAPIIHQKSKLAKIGM